MNSLPREAYLICSAYRSCFDASITLRNMHVFCDAQLACDEAVIAISGNKYKNTIACRAYQGCFEATMTGAYQIQCLGQLSCEQSIIHNVDEIYGLGYQSLQDATIYSDGVGRMNVALGAHMSGENLIIECNQEDDYCKINCFGHACENTTVICYFKATCVVDCNDTAGILCPNITIYKPPTASPSLLPSTIPSAIPSNKPTTIPTAIPTSQPTYIPTHPTSGPTTIPTTEPSVNPSFMPSTVPTKIPTAQPSVVPTAQPSSQRKLYSIIIIICLCDCVFCKILFISLHGKLCFMFFL